MRKKIEDTLTIFFISALCLLTYSTEGYPTIEPGKEAITASHPCNAKHSGNNLTLSFNAGTELTLPDYRGVCARRCLLPEKIACLMPGSSITKCIDESSTAALCRSNTFNINLQKYPNGTYAIRFTGPEELIVLWSPVCMKADFSRTSTDLECYYNGSASEMASNQTNLTEKPTSKLPPASTAPTNSTLTSSLKVDLDDDTPTHANSTVAPIASLKPDPDVGTTTNSTVKPSLKPDPDAGIPTNSSTVTPSLKPYPNAGKLGVGPIVGFVLGGILAALILIAPFYYLCKKRAKRRDAKNRTSFNYSNGSNKEGNQVTAM